MVFIYYILYYLIRKRFNMEICFTLKLILPTHCRHNWFRKNFWIKIHRIQYINIYISPNKFIKKVHFHLILLKSTIILWEHSSSWPCNIFWLLLMKIISEYENIAISNKINTRRQIVTEIEKVDLLFFDIKWCVGIMQCKVERRATGSYAGARTGGNVVASTSSYSYSLHQSGNNFQMMSPKVSCCHVHKLWYYHFCVPEDYG